MITISVVLPTTITKYGSKSLQDLVDFYKIAQNSETSQICQAAIACGARAYKLLLKSRDFVHNGNKIRLRHVTLSLDFDDINAMARFMETYSMIV